MCAWMGCDRITIRRKRPITTREKKTAQEATKKKKEKKRTTEVSPSPPPPASPLPNLWRRPATPYVLAGCRGEWYGPRRQQRQHQLPLGTYALVSRPMQGMEAVMANWILGWSFCWWFLHLRCLILVCFDALICHFILCVEGRGSQVLQKNTVVASVVIDWRCHSQHVQTLQKFWTILFSWEIGR